MTLKVIGRQAGVAPNRAATPRPAVMEKVAELIRDDRDTDAADLFQRHAVAQYGR